MHGTNVNHILPYLIPSTYSGVTKVELYVDGGLVASDTSSPYNFVWDSAGVANGPHTLITKAYDQANNVGTSTSVTVTVNNVASVDTAP
jgi:hypothetical protein